MNVVALLVAGYGLMIAASMLNRGLSVAVIRDDDGHEWMPDLERSYASRVLGFVAGVPTFILLTSASIRSIGWWTLTVILGGCVAAFVITMLLRGGSRERVARRMNAVRLPVTFLAFCMGIAAAAFT